MSITTSTAADARVCPCATKTEDLITDDTGACQANAHTDDVAGVTGKAGDMDGRESSINDISCNKNRDADTCISDSLVATSMVGHTEDTKDTSDDNYTVPHSMTQTTLAPTMIATGESDMAVVGEEHPPPSPPRQQQPSGPTLMPAEPMEAVSTPEVDAEVEKDTSRTDVHANSDNAQPDGAAKDSNGKTTTIRKREGEEEEDACDSTTSNTVRHTTSPHADNRVDTSTTATHTHRRADTTAHSAPPDDHVDPASRPGTRPHTDAGDTEETHVHHESVAAAATVAASEPTSDAALSAENGSTEAERVPEVVQHLRTYFGALAPALEPLIYRTGLIGKDVLDMYEYFYIWAPFIVETVVCQIGFSPFAMHMRRILINLLLTDFNDEAEMMVDFMMQFADNTMLFISLISVEALEELVSYARQMLISSPQYDRTFSMTLDPPGGGGRGSGSSSSYPSRGAMDGKMTTTTASTTTAAGDFHATHRNTGAGDRLESGKPGYHSYRHVGLDYSAAASGLGGGHSRIMGRSPSDGGTKMSASMRMSASNHTHALTHLSDAGANYRSSQGVDGGAPGTGEAANVATTAGRHYDPISPALSDAAVAVSFSSSSTARGGAGAGGGGGSAAAAHTHMTTPRVSTGRGGVTSATTSRMHRGSAPPTAVTATAGHSSHMMSHTQHSSSSSSGSVGAHTGRMGSGGSNYGSHSTHTSMTHVAAMHSGGVMTNANHNPNTDSSNSNTNHNNNHVHTYPNHTSQSSSSLARPASSSHAGLEYHTAASHTRTDRYAADSQTAPPRTTHVLSGGAHHTSAPPAPTALTATPPPMPSASATSSASPSSRPAPGYTESGSHAPASQARERGGTAATSHHTSGYSMRQTPQQSALSSGYAPPASRATSAGGEIPPPPPPPPLSSSSSSQASYAPSPPRKSNASSAALPRSPRPPSTGTHVFLISPAHGHVPNKILPIPQHRHNLMMHAHAHMHEYALQQQQPQQHTVPPTPHGGEWPDTTRQPSSPKASSGTCTVSTPAVAATHASAMQQTQNTQSSSPAIPLPRKSAIPAPLSVQQQTKQPPRPPPMSHT